MNLSDIDQAVVVAVGRSVEERRLIGFVKGRIGTSLNPDALREALILRLPEYMVPSLLVVVDEFPLTPSGKVDRDALSRTVLPGTEHINESGPPSTALEQMIADHWSELLGVRNIGLHDDFFRLGGHSLMTTRAISKLRVAIALALPIRSIFEAPTVARFTRLVCERIAARVTESGSEEIVSQLERQSLWLQKQTHQE